MEYQLSAALRFLIALQPGSGSTKWKLEEFKVHGSRQGHKKRCRALQPDLLISKQDKPWSSVLLACLGKPKWSHGACLLTKRLVACKPACWLGRIFITLVMAYSKRWRTRKEVPPHQILYVRYFRNEIFKSPQQHQNPSLCTETKYVL